MYCTQTVHKSNVAPRAKLIMLIVQMSAKSQYCGRQITTKVPLNSAGSVLLRRKTVNERRARAQAAHVKDAGVVEGRLQVVEPLSQGRILECQPEHGGRVWSLSGTCTHQVRRPRN